MAVHQTADDHARLNFERESRRATKPAIADDELEDLRSRYYTAVVIGTRDVHAGLRILRVQPDWGRLAYTPGQYTVLALGEWEPCVEERSADEATGSHIIRRAYSVCSTMLDGAGSLVRPRDCNYLEFYVALAPSSGHSRPKLTPRLFRLQPGQRLYIGAHAHGRYTLAGTSPKDQIVFVATGTGEAPHNAMLIELLASGHLQPIIAVTCVRHRRDLAYLSVHRELERQFPNYRYLPLTTREPENIDPQAPGYVGKRHLQGYFESGDFERAAGIWLDPTRTHVFLCGNPAMVGLPGRGPGGLESNKHGMVEILQRRGFSLDAPANSGNLHCERFW